MFVRGQDTAGNWGALLGIDLVVDKTAPVLEAVVATPNPTNGAATLTLTAPVNETSFAAAEFWLGSADPGAGKGVRVPVSLVDGKIVVTVPLAGVASGNQQVNLRVQDLAGNWSNAVHTTVTVKPPNAIFSDTFDSGSLAAWSTWTGGVSVTPASSHPAGVTSRGLQVTLPGGAGNRASYVTDTSPNGETGYHASFSLNANTLTSGTVNATVLTLFEGRTAANGPVFTVQFHRLASGIAQVRTVMSRSGAAALTGQWVNLPAGAHTIRVDWSSGPATGGTTGSLKLLVDGTTASSIHRQHHHPAGRHGPARCDGRGHRDAHVLDEGHGVRRLVRVHPLHAALRQPTNLPGPRTPCAAPGAIREEAPCRITPHRSAGARPAHH